MHSMHGASIPSRSVLWGFHSIPFRFRSAPCCSYPSLRVSSLSPPFGQPFGLTSVHVERLRVGPHRRRGRRPERQRDYLVVERREHGFVVALDDHQWSYHSLQEEVLVV